MFDRESKLDELIAEQAQQQNMDRAALARLVDAVEKLATGVLKLANNVNAIEKRVSAIEAGRG